MINEILICNFERQNEINKRILERNTPFCNTSNLINIRGESTKYTFPILNNNSNCLNIDNIKFNNETCFKNYSLNIDVESKLKNQDKKLNNSPDNDYIPSSNSNLYTNTLQIDNTNEFIFTNFLNKNLENENNNKNKKDYFFNKLFNTDTRQELKN